MKYEGSVMNGIKIISGNHLVYRPTNRPTDQPTDQPTISKTIYPLFFKGRHKNNHITEIDWTTCLDESCRANNSPVFISLWQYLKSLLNLTNLKASQLIYVYKNITCKKYKTRNIFWNNKLSISLLKRVHFFIPSLPSFSSISLDLQCTS